MKNAIIIHGAYGSPKENWFPWLKGELEKQEYVVDVPQFPTPENQDLGAWLKIAGPHLNRLNPESLLIGHSIGATFILSLLEKLTEANQPRTVLGGRFYSGSTRPKPKCHQPQLLS